MKTGQFRSVLMAVMGPLFVQVLCLSVANGAPAELTDGDPTSAQTAATSTNVVNEAGTLYKTIVDNTSGQYAVVDTNKEVVTLRDKADKVIWSVNVAEALKMVPIAGERKIHNMQMIKGELIVTFARGFAKIDRKSGSLEWLGSD